MIKSQNDKIFVINLEYYIFINFDFIFIKSLKFYMKIYLL